ncbi:MAG: hypothetical protein ABIA92_04230 [Patescibacteria group bacterium]
MKVEPHGDILTVLSGLVELNRKLEMLDFEKCEEKEINYIMQLSLGYNQHMESPEDSSPDGLLDLYRSAVISSGEVPKTDDDIRFFFENIPVDDCDWWLAEFRRDPEETAMQINEILDIDFRGPPTLDTEIQRDLQQYCNGVADQATEQRLFQWVRRNIFGAEE